MNIGNQIKEREFTFTSPFADHYPTRPSAAVAATLIPLETGLANDLDGKPNHLALILGNDAATAPCATTYVANTGKPDVLGLASALATDGSGRGRGGVFAAFIDELMANIQFITGATQQQSPDMVGTDAARDVPLHNVALVLAGAGACGRQRGTRARDGECVRACI